MAGGSDSQIHEIKQRLAVIEAQLQQLFTHLQVEPRQLPQGATDGGGGWWGSSDEAADAGGTPPSGEVIALVEAGKEIQAIKMYREQTGLGLKEAKDAIVSYGRR
jgi:ribosomal protein L7/L12